MALFLPASTCLLNSVLNWLKLFPYSPYLASDLDSVLDSAFDFDSALASTFDSTLIACVDVKRRAAIANKLVFIYFII